jgi:hypothetical protein
MAYEQDWVKSNKRVINKSLQKKTKIPKGWKSSYIRGIGKGLGLAAGAYIIGAGLATTATQLYNKATGYENVRTKKTKRRT